MAEPMIEMWVDGKPLADAELNAGKTYKLRVKAKCPDGKPCKGGTVTVTHGAGTGAATTDSAGEAICDVRYNEDFNGTVTVRCDCADTPYVKNYAVTLHETLSVNPHKSFVKFVSNLTTSAIAYSVVQGNTQFEATIREGEVTVLDGSGLKTRRVPLSGILVIQITSTDDLQIIKLILEELEAKESYFRLNPEVRSHLLVDLRTGQISGEIHTLQIASQPYRYDANVYGYLSSDGGFFAFTSGSREPVHRTFPTIQV